MGYSETIFKFEMSPLAENCRPPFLDPKSVYHLRDPFAHIPTLIGEVKHSSTTFVHIIFIVLVLPPTMTLFELHVDLIHVSCATVHYYRTYPFHSESLSSD